MSHTKQICHRSRHHRANNYTYSVIRFRTVLKYISATTQRSRIVFQNDTARYKAMRLDITAEAKGQGILPLRHEQAHSLQAKALGLKFIKNISKRTKLERE